MYLKLKNFRPRKIFLLLKFCRKYYSPITLKYWILLISCIRYHIKGGFRPDEVFNLGLGFRSSLLSDEKINKPISHRESNKILNTLNPFSLWRMIIVNKGIFYMNCMNLNLPIPQSYAIVFKDFMSLTFRNLSLVKPDNLIQFIQNELPNEFVIKPLTGTGGDSINIYSKTNDGIKIKDGYGNFKTIKEINDSIINNKKHNSFIVQERLKNHPYLSKIHRSENLHTIRIITLVNSSGQCRILHGHLNISTGQKIASQQGNLKISISLNDGGLEYGVIIDKKNGGFEKTNQHPESGQDLRKFKLPLWKEVISLSKEAALKFLPIRTLGWDFALTEKGVIILEANICYAPPNFFRSMDQFIDTLLHA